MEWRDISSAPKDGTPILTFKKPYIGQEKNPLRHVYWGGTVWQIYGGNSFFPPNSFSHWMPLPEPPVTA